MVYIILSVIAIVSGLKWAKWRIAALSIANIVIENYREPAGEELEHYKEIAIKKMLHVL